MTLLEVKNLLLSYYIQNDSFDLKEDIDFINFSDIKLNEGFFKENKKDLVVAALKEIESSGLIVRLDSKTKNIWVLTKPIGKFSQTVVLTPYTVELVAEIVNSLNNVIGGNTDSLCNKLSIEEEDIMNLVKISHKLIDSYANKVGAAAPPSNN